MVIRQTSLLYGCARYAKLFSSSRLRFIKFTITYYWPFILLSCRCPSFSFGAFFSNSSLTLFSKLNASRSPTHFLFCFFCALISSTSISAISHIAQCSSVFIESTINRYVVYLQSFCFFLRYIDVRKLYNISVFVNYTFPELRSVGLTISSSTNADPNIKYYSVV